MKINRDKLFRWLEGRFGNVRQRGNELCVDSPFCSDTKGHLWLNPDKGKFHCWKTDKGGSIWWLLCEIDHCSKQQAMKEIYDDWHDLTNFETQIKEVSDLFTPDNREAVVARLPKGFSSLVPGRRLGVIGQRVLQYLKSRKITPWKYRLGYCYEGPYASHVIIPIYDEGNRLVYWIARSIIPNDRSRYKNPPREIFGVDKTNILWIHNHHSNKAYVCEGIFDAISLVECGLNGVAILGKTLSRGQAMKLSEYQTVVLALDNDREADKKLLQNVGILQSFGCQDVRLCRPNAKDWNQMLVSGGRENIISWVQGREHAADLGMQIIHLFDGQQI